MKYIPPKKLKVLMALFFGTGLLGITVGLTIKNPNHIMITFLGVINLCLGGFVGWLFLTQAPKSRDKRKK